MTDIDKLIERMMAWPCVQDCDNGAIPHGPDPDGNWDAEQCQFCYEREEAAQALRELRDDREAARRERDEVREELEYSQSSQDSLANEMVYHGNSVQHWYAKAQAYKKYAGQHYDTEQLKAENEHSQEVIERVALLRLDLESENRKLRALCKAAKNLLDDLDNDRIDVGSIGAIEQAIAAIEDDTKP